MTVSPHLVLSMDTGVDDALALAYLIASGAHIIGVSATYGNVLQQQAARNTRTVLDLLGRADVPVADGARHPSWAPLFVADAGCARFHGRNGLADLRIGVSATPKERPGRVIASDAAGIVTLSAADVGALIRQGHAISVGGYPVGDPHAELPTIPEFFTRAGLATPQKLGFPDEDCSTMTDGARLIVDAARRYGDALTIVATGPLTDVDVALRADPAAVRRARIVFMGGALTQEGNCYDLVCETNVLQDPEAADRVLRAHADTTMIGLDVTHRCLLGPADVARWLAVADDDGSAGKPSRRHVAFLLASLANFSIRANRASDPIFAGGMPLHDPLAAAVALDPLLVTTFDLPMIVETRTGDGVGVRGRTIGDPRGAIDDATAAHVALGVDSAGFVRRFTDAIAGLLASLG
ncbi:nucleoside hydrolase [Bifidobacterium italicum]|uniref:Nucleoside hydrolase n=1 Tax=Bifidobacterium italicum TaxID=1960968 RepID=A0A2A2EJF8_9BIFI|nr:nucleoside hydrolase [Bifidobacterium italicum]PAU69137.1 nucleoside hydrolase [Bifidobacterium italicum]